MNQIFAAFPATALDLLKKEVPTLSSSLVKARSTQAGLLEVEAAFNDIRPGLHDELANLPNSWAGGRAYLRAVQAALGKQPWEVV